MLEMVVVEVEMIDLTERMDAVGVEVMVEMEMMEVGCQS